MLNYVIVVFSLDICRKLYNLGFIRLMKDGLIDLIYEWKNFFGNYFFKKCILFRLKCLIDKIW